MNRRLYRSRNERIVFGVAGGLGDYVHVDPSIVRILWVILAFATFGVAVLLYVAMALIVPESPEGTGDDWDWGRTRSGYQWPEPGSPDNASSPATSGAATTTGPATSGAPPATSGAPPATPGPTLPTTTPPRSTQATPPAPTAPGDGASTAAASLVGRPPTVSSSVSSTAPPGSAPPGAQSTPTATCAPLGTESIPLPPRPAPGTPGGPAATPPPNAAWSAAQTRSEARRARHEAHEAGRAARGDRRGALFFGIVLILIGGYFFVRSYVPAVDVDQLWPIIAIAIGLLLIVGAFRRRPTPPA